MYDCMGALFGHGQEEEEEEEEEGNVLERGSYKYLMSRRDEPIYPGAKITVMQVGS